MSKRRRPFAEQVIDAQWIRDSFNPEVLDFIVEHPLEDWEVDVEDRGATVALVARRRRDTRL
jgi:hypothetical protein